MKLFYKYFVFTLQQAMKDPRKAFKVLPGLAFLLFGIVYMIIMFTTMRASMVPTEMMMYTGVLYALGISSFFYIMLLVQNITGGALGFRSCDANLLMTAPVSRFDAYMFVLMKSAITYIGLSFFVASTQSPGIIQLTNNKNVIITIIFALLISLLNIGMLAYIVIYFRLKNEKLTKLISAIIVGVIIVGGFTLYQMNGLAFMKTDWVHYIPFVGWNLGIAYHAVFGNFTMMMVYYGLSIVALIILFILAKTLKFDYYEYELIKVSKTDKAYSKMMGGSQQDVKFFKKSKHEMRHLNEKSIIDLAKIKAGKFWMVSLINLMTLGFTLFFMISINLGIKNEMENVNYFLTTVFLVVGVELYMGTFTFTDNGVFTDFYLKLIPIKSVYKVIYYHYVKYLNVFLNAFIYAAAAVALHFIAGVPLHYAAYTFVIAVLFGISEVFRLENTWVYITNRFGKTITIILSILYLLLAGAIVFGGGLAILFGLNNEILAFAYLIVISIIFAIIWAIVGKKLYDNVDMSEYKTA